jgi:hypothetical protein
VLLLPLLGDEQGNYVGVLENPFGKPDPVTLGGACLFRRGDDFYGFLCGAVHAAPFGWWLLQVTLSRRTSRDQPLFGQCFIKEKKP